VGSRLAPIGTPPFGYISVKFQYVVSFRGGLPATRAEKFYLKVGGKAAGMKGDQLVFEKNPTLTRGAQTPLRSHRDGESFAERMF
jgi:hypothetical protein